jgi:hypothetical protein
MEHIQFKSTIIYIYISVKANTKAEIGKKIDQSNIGFWDFVLCFNTL